MEEENSKVIKEGWLYKRGGGKIKIWRRRWFELDLNRRLTFYKYEDSEKIKCGIIPLEGCALRVVIGKRVSLELYHPTLQLTERHPSYFITSDTPEDLNDWNLSLSHFFRVFLSFLFF